VAEPHFVDHEVEVFLNVTTTHDDIEAALARSGLVEGELLGEALILNVQVYSPEVVDAD
jgi:hypothetical protein